MIPSPPAAVVFDFDGLMLDTEWTAYMSTNAVFEAHGTELSLELWTSFIGTTDHPHWGEILAEQLGAPVDMDVWQPWRAADGMARASALELLEGVGELIGLLSEAGIPMAVASSSRREWVRVHLEQRGLLARFEALCTGDEVDRTKPDPALYRLACDRLDVAPSAAVALEDSVVGVSAAKAAGLFAVAVPGRMTAHLDYSSADLVVSSCAALPAALGLGDPGARNIAR